jgi:hypothetical protein
MQENPVVRVTRESRGQSFSRIANKFGYCNPVRQSRNQKAEALTAEYAEYAENRLPAGSPSVYSAYSAVPSSACPCYRPTHEDQPAI